MKALIKPLFVILTLVEFSCSKGQLNSTNVTRADSVYIIQTVLNDSELVKEANLYFGQEMVRLVRQPIIEQGYDLTFRNRKVTTISQEYFDRNVINSRDYLVISIPMFKSISPDSAQISMVAYPGKATFLYTFVRQDNVWRIVDRRVGKL